MVKLKPCITPYVPKKWNRIFIVGEAPSSQEEKTGKPFVGPSGKFLTKLLEDADIKRSECYITNVWLIHPPKNDISIFYNKHGIVLPQYQLDWSRLFGELNKYAPKIIITLGRTAAVTLLGHLPYNLILKDVVNKLHFNANGMLLPIYHPAYLMRPDKANLIPPVLKQFKLIRRMIKSMA